MAEMIPETLAESLNLTTGERRVFDLLRDCLVPHTDYIVWYEPRSARRLPDFLVWAPRWGLLVIEVKDWRYPTIAEATQNVWTLRLPDFDQTHAQIHAAQTRAQTHGSQTTPPNPLRWTVPPVGV